MDKKTAEAVQKFTGSVGVNSNITPTTRQPIPEITSDMWSEMNITELWEQKIALQSRMSIVVANHSDPKIIAAMTQGLQLIDAIIASKDPTETPGDMGLI